MEMEKRFDGKIYKYWMSYTRKDVAEREVKRLRGKGNSARLFYDKSGYKKSGWDPLYQPWLVYTYGRIQ